MPYMDGMGQFNMKPKSDSFQKGISYARVPFSVNFVKLWEGNQYEEQLFLITCSGGFAGFLNHE